jgi:peptidoglycan hydrolase-like protein with peptidoglycan-binding domain
MALQSALFSDDAALQACLVNDRAHVGASAVGDHVTKIHSALVVIDNSPIDVAELRNGRYGPSTAAAVLAYKRKRQIVNHSYQTQADDIVGKMTIASLDREMLLIEGQEAQRAFPPRS